MLPSRFLRCLPSAGMLLGAWIVVVAQAGAQTPAPAAAAHATAARDLGRGAVLEAVDFVLAPDADPAAAPVGWVTRRVVREGEPLRPPAIGPVDAVRSGEGVQLLWSDGAIELRMRGRAMNSAPAGGKVLVRVDERRRFEGIALGAGVVRLAPMQEDRAR